VISLFSIKPHFLLRLEIDGLILQSYQSVISAKFHHIRYIWQYLLIKAATLVVYVDCSETQVATSSIINLTEILCTIPYDVQPSDCIK